MIEKIFSLAAAVTLAAAVSSLRAAEGPPLRSRQDEGSFTVSRGERTLWRLNFAKGGKPFFHPLSTAGGTELTWDRPPDHPWHRALWFSWKFIDGVNYWEENPATGKVDGETEIVETKTEMAAGDEARAHMRLAYHPPGKPPVLTEERTLRITAPDDRGAYRIDWTSSFDGGGRDVRLDRTPILGQKDGVSWGGYAGLSLRTAKGFRDWKVVDSEGRRDLDISAKTARWVDFSGAGESGAAAGFAIFDHPRNPRHPTPWYVILEKPQPFGYASPAFIYREPYVLAAGEKLVLRYRIVVHDGAGDPKAIEAEWKGWSEAPLPAAASAPKVLGFTVRDIRGSPVPLSKYAGKVLLIVNVASRCGYTPQYAGLQKLHETYGPKGLAVLGFPANEFGGQEPGTDEEILGFCTSKYSVGFDMFSKVVVKGEGKVPLYGYLTSGEPAIEDRGEVKWNFEKFLVDRKGAVIARFRSKVTPEEIAPAIEKALAGK
jgi:glutathione peroxidase-family protein